MRDRQPQAEEPVPTNSVIVFVILSRAFFFFPSSSLRGYLEVDSNCSICYTAMVWHSPERFAIRQSGARYCPEYGTGLGLSKTSIQLSWQKKTGSVPDSKTNAHSVNEILLPFKDLLVFGTSFIFLIEYCIYIQLTKYSVLKLYLFNFQFMSIVFNP